MLHVVNRLVISLLALTAVAGGAYLLLASSGIVGLPGTDGVPGLEEWIGFLQGQPAAPTVVGSLTAGVGAGLVVLILELRPARPRPHLVLREDKLGVVSISMAGLTRLVEHVAGELTGVERAAASASAGRDGLVLLCRIVVNPDASTTELAEELRRRAAEAVRSHTGREVHRIHVQAQIGTAPSLKKRVR